MFDDHGAGYSASGVAHEVFEQGKLLRRQLDAFAAAFHLARHPVQFQIGDPQHGFHGPRPSPQQCPYPRRKLSEGEWLGQAIVGAGIQRLHPVLDAAARRQHQHRQ